MACLLCMAALVMGQATQPAHTPTPASSTPAAHAPGNISGEASGASGPSGGGPATAIAGLPLNANVAVIPVHGPIRESTLDHLKFRLDTSVANGATLIVIELDTTGGDLLAALRISQLLRGSNVPTLAWVNNMAYSAGILIASACDAIIMSPTSAMGDCAPVRYGWSGMVPLPATERAKTLSPLLDEFNSNAQAHQYDMALFQAMCILDVRVYEIRHPQTGQTRFVNQDDYAIMVKGEEYDVIAAQPSSPDRPIAMALTIAAPADRAQWELVRQVHDGKTLLTVNQTQAQDMGLSKAQVADISQLRQTLAANQLSVRPITWSQNTAFFLSLGWVRALLVVIMFLAAYFELQAPGLGIGAVVAITALVLLVAGPMTAGLAQWWHVLLVIAGFIALLIEIFAVPGFGLIGASGLLAMFVGLTLMAVPTSSGAFNLPPSATASRLQAAALWMLLAIIFSGVGVAILTRYFGSIPFVSRLMLTDAQSPMMAQGDAAAQSQAVTQPARPVAGDEVLGHGSIKVGDRGKAINTLRPSGSARIGQHVVDVITDGQWIDANTPVQVVQSVGSRIVVAPADTTDDSPSA